MKQCHLLYLASTLSHLPDAAKALTAAGFNLSLADDLHELIELGRTARPDFVLCHSGIPLTDFVLLHNMLRNRKNKSRSRIVIFDDAKHLLSPNDFERDSFFQVSTPKNITELLACISTIAQLNEMRARIDIGTQDLENALTEYETKLQQSIQTERNLARQLWKERERLDRSQAVAKTGSWETHLPSKNVNWTLETHRIFGTDPDSFNPTHERFLELVHPEDRDNVRSAFDESLTSTEAHTIEHRIVRPDGNESIAEEHWSTETDETGNIVRVLGTCRDISEKRRAEEDRDRLFRLSEDLLTVASFDGRLTVVNPAWSKVLGWTRQELEEKGFYSYMHPDDIKKTEIAIENTLGVGKVLLDFETRFICKDGSIRWISWNAHPQPDFRQILSIGRDITEKKSAELELKKLEDRLQLVMDAASLGYWDLNLDTMRTWRSIWHDRCFGYNELQDNWSYEILLQHIHPDDRDHVDRTFQKARENSSSFRVEFRVIWPDKSTHWLYTIGRFIRNDEGNVVRTAGVILDISERKLLEEQLRRSQRLESMGQLTGGIAHDFNNLLTVIIGNAEVLKEDLARTHPLLPMAEMIFDAAERGSQLVQRMLAFSRKQRLEPTSLNLNELIEHLLPILHRSVGQEIEIGIQLDQELWLCRVDSSELENCVINLSINARDAMQRTGKLVIETSNFALCAGERSPILEMDPGDYVLISVEDNGIGMSKEVQEKIFEPFFTTKSAGSGLGLAMVYGFIKQSGGHVLVTSALGKGTKVCLYLPAIQDSQITKEKE